MKKILLIILLFITTINSSFALSETEKTELLHQANKAFSNFEKKISKSDTKKQIETLNSVIERISPFTIYRDKISEKNSFLLNNLQRLFMEKRKSIQDRENRINTLLSKYYELKLNENNSSQVEQELLTLWVNVGDVKIQTEVKKQLLNKKYLELYDAGKYIQAKELEKELNEIGLYTSRVTDTQITIEKLKNEYYSYRSSKQWDLMRETENKLVPYKIFFWDKWEILPIDDSQPLIYTQRGEAPGLGWGWGVWNRPRVYLQSDVSDQLWNKVKLVNMKNIWVTNIVGVYNEIQLWKVEWRNNAIIPPDFITWNYRFADDIKNYSIVFWKLDGKPLYELQIMTYNYMLPYYKEWKILWSDYMKTDSLLSNPLWNKKQFKERFWNLWYYFDSKWKIYFDVNLVDPNIKALDFIPQ